MTVGNPDGGMPPQPAPTKGVIGCLLLAVGFVSCLSYISHESPEEKVKRETQDRLIMAYVMSQKFVKRSLVAPATADFPQYRETGVNVAELGGGRFSVRGYVDAENRFGAKIRNQYLCTLKDLGNDEWQLEGEVLLLE